MFCVFLLFDLCIVSVGASAPTAAAAAANFLPAANTAGPAPTCATLNVAKVRLISREQLYCPNNELAEEFLLALHLLMTSGARSATPYLGSVCQALTVFHSVSDWV